MVKCNDKLIFLICLMLSLVFECQLISRYRCPLLLLTNGRVRTRSNGRIARISCNPPFKLTRGKSITTCIDGKWDGEPPLCSGVGCPIIDDVAHGQLSVLDEGSTLKVVCDAGYILDGPSTIYCNSDLEWSEEIRGCKENDQLHMSCDFESPDERFCGWQNYNLNDVDWFADRFSSIIFRPHIPAGSSQYFTRNYISLDAGNYGLSTFGRLISPPINPTNSKQKCLIFSYKVMPGNSRGIPTLTVTFGGIPHWVTSEGEGRVIIGLYQFNVTSKIMIEGKCCKAAIDNLVITEGNSCTRQPYEEETDTCHDNCGKIASDYACSCDWKCHYNDNCCSDITIKCPYIKPLEEIYKLYLTTKTPIPSKISTTVKNNVLNINVSSLSFPYTFLNRSTILNEYVFGKTPTNEPNIIINNVTTNIVTPPVSTSINTTYSTFSLMPLEITTKKLSTITITPSTKISTAVPKKNTLNLNSTLLFKDINISTTMSSNTDSINLENTTTLKTASTTTTAILKSIIIDKNSSTDLIYPSNFTTKSVLINAPSTTQTLINSSSTIKHLIIDSATTTTLSSILSSTNKSKIENTTIKTTKPINISDTTIKPTIINTTIPKKSYNPFTIKLNVSNQDDQLNVTFISKPNKTQNEIVVDRKPIINNSTSRLPVVFDYSNINLIPGKKNYGFDIIQIPNINKTLNNKPSFHNDSSLTKTNQSTNRIKPQFWTSVNPVTTELPQEKPELNYSLHNQHKLNVDTFISEHGKQNEYTKSSYTTDYYIVTIIKFIAGTGIILITFKSTLYIKTWYFKKPCAADDTASCLIQTDKEDICDMELTSNSVK